MWPERITGLVCVNSYLIQNIAKAMVPTGPAGEKAIWYQYYFHNERGVAGLTANRRELTKLLWKDWSPNWKFDDATFERSAVSFDNPDFVPVVIHNYRHRFGLVDGDPRYAALQLRLAALPVISVPSITLDGGGDGVITATNGKAFASRFSGQRSHRIVPKVGHNLPQEAPKAFADAVGELASAKSAS